MRIITPYSLRELASAGRPKLPSLNTLWETLEQVAAEIESRDAEIDGLKRALAAVRELEWAATYVRDTLGRRGCRCWGSCALCSEREKQAAKITPEAILELIAMVRR